MSSGIASSRAAKIFVLAARVILGAVLIYAAYVKLRDPWQLFAMSIDSYRILPLKLVEIAARTIPWMELAIGVLLIAGIWLRVSGAIASLLLLTFFGLMVRAYAQGLEISCGCFGPGEVISWKTLLRDGALVATALAMTGLAFLNHRRKKSTA